MRLWDNAKKQHLLVGAPNVAIGDYGYIHIYTWNTLPKSFSVEGISPSSLAKGDITVALTFLYVDPILGAITAGQDYNKATVTPFIDEFKVDAQTQRGVNGISFFNGQNGLLGIGAGLGSPLRLPGVKINSSVDLSGPNGRLSGTTEFVQDIAPANGGVDGSPGSYIFQVGMNNVVANLVPLPGNHFPLLDTPQKQSGKVPPYYYHSTDVWVGGFSTLPGHRNEYSIKEEDSPSTLYQIVNPPVPLADTKAANGAPIVSTRFYDPAAGVNLLPNLQKVDSRYYFTNYLMWRFKGTTVSLAFNDWQVSFLASFAAINRRSGIDSDLLYTVSDEGPARITPPPANKGILVR